MFVALLRLLAANAVVVLVHLALDRGHGADALDVLLIEDFPHMGGARGSPSADRLRSWNTVKKPDWTIDRWSRADM